MLFNDKFFYSVLRTACLTVLLFLAIIAGICLNTRDVFAQISHGGEPYSFTHDLPQNVPTVTMQPVDVQALLAEDRAGRQQDRPVPPRFGKALEVSLGLNNSGRWDELPGGAGLWRLRIASQGARSINLIFDRYKLPPGGQLFIYNEDRSTVLGSFTGENNKPYGRFSTLPVEGALITLEYYEPAEEWGNTELRISRVIHAYKDLLNSGAKSHNVGFGASHSCNINVNCPEGDSWQDEKRSVAMVLVDQNTRLCSGALVNDVPQSLIPHVLTAFHCADNNLDGSLSTTEINDAENWLFWFNYESASCSNPGSEPGHDGISGSTFKAGNNASDFLLVKLSIKPRYSYNTWYAGWDAIGNTPSSSVTIHHPSGDIKKISIDNDSPVSSDYDPNPGPHPSNSHWEVVDWDAGTTEQGSSGAPLFDPNHRVVGQLHGGFAACGNNLSDYYGKFSMSWDYGSTASERIKDWLDPNNTGTQVLDGITGPTDMALRITISGPQQVLQGESNTWTADVSGGNPPYDTYHWYQWTETNPFWAFACPDSGPSCTTSFQDAGEAKIKVEVFDEGRYFGDEIYSLFVYSSGFSARQLAGPSLEEEMPEKFAVQEPHPNPFNPITVIPFQLPEQGHVLMEVYNLTGQQIAVLADRAYEAGFHRITFDGRGLSSGAYFVRTRFNGKIMTQKIVLIK